MKIILFFYQNVGFQKLYFLLQALWIHIFDAICISISSERDRQTIKPQMGKSYCRSIEVNASDLLVLFLSYFNRKKDSLLTFLWQILCSSTLDNRQQPLPFLGSIGQCIAQCSEWWRSDALFVVTVQKHETI